MKFLLQTVLLLLFALSITNVQATEFTFAGKNSRTTILYDPRGPAIDSISAHLLAADIQRVSGYLPEVITGMEKARGNVIIIGNISSALVQQFLNKGSAVYKGLSGKWECFGLAVLQKPLKNIDRVLVITGSNNRGTAYGVFHVSEMIGVSPWYWWADVPVSRKAELTLDINQFISQPPAVKYRGIFINDEDWGLQPWAAKTFEPETGDIGPKTYAKIFELLLRLKANLVWPAMHPSTKAFYYYPGNKKMAADYTIIIGSSHAEPMLRNNVSEWDHATMGDFNYFTNTKRVQKYWEDRVKESSLNNGMYSLGMRGIHDSGIEGVKDPKEAVPVIERIFADQRNMLRTYINKDVTAVPQVFTAYKEVLDIYDNGLKVPEDVTLVWPDDNYGYIQRLNNEKEQQRAGGSGVYYHASYWGRPHDYLWLSSTHPGLMREEMMKSVDMRSDRLWVLNIGDLKPLEYNIQYFMDMAYDPKPFKESAYSKKHLLGWLTNIFGNGHAPAISDVLWEYYQLAFERRPEFMGWSQTEPTTKTNPTAYNHSYYGDQAQRRIDRYELLEKEVKALRTKLDPAVSDAFYELVYYPVVGASLMNKKFIYRDKSVLYAKQQRAVAADYAALAKAAYDSIVIETAYFNTVLAGGKWNHIMSMKPRALPVFNEPVVPVISQAGAGGWSVAPEGMINPDSTLPSGGYVLPLFNRWSKSQRYFIDIFLQGNAPVKWTATRSQPWIGISQQNGLLENETGKRQQRLWITVETDQLPAGDSIPGQLVFEAGGKKVAVSLAVLNPPALSGYKGFMENNGYVSMFASRYSRITNKQASSWELLQDIGQTGASLQARPLQFSSSFDLKDTALVKSRNASVEYDFYVSNASPATVHVFSLPSHPLNNNYSLRYALSIDNGPLVVTDTRTYGRSEEWKQFVLQNNVIRKIPFPLLDKGKHVLRIYAVDPGLVLDRVIIDLGGLKKSYGVIPETRAGLQE